MLVANIIMGTLYILLGMQLQKILDNFKKTP
jgi:hypothetical protein